MTSTQKSLSEPIAPKPEDSTTMFKGFFDTQTFRDHANHPSIGRKSIFWIGVVMVLLLFAALLCIAFLAPLERAKLISTFAISVLGIGAGMFATAYASAQYSKAKAHQSQQPTPPMEQIVDTANTNNDKPAGK